MNSDRILEGVKQVNILNQTVVAPDGEKAIVGKEDESDISTEILILVFLLILSSAAANFLKKSGHKYLQEAGSTVLIGMTAGLIFKLC